MGDSRAFPNIEPPGLGEGQDPHPIFSSVFQSFKETVLQQHVAEFQEIKNLEDLDLAIREIEKQQANRKCLRNMQKARPFLNALDQYSQVIEVFVNAKPDMLAFIWGPIKLCLQIASRFTRAFDSLLDAYAKLKDALPNISAVEHLFGSHEHVKVVLADVYKDILTFHDRATKFFSRKGWKIALALTCRTFDDMFDDVLCNLERSKQLLLTSADIAHFREAQEARFKFQDYIGEERNRARIERKFRVRSWLKPHLHITQHHDLRQVRQQYPQTTKWIFQELAWKDWLRTSRDTARVLWLSGIPGAGKTVLFSSIVDEIGRTISDRAETGLVYLYCKYKDQHRDNFVEITKSLIHQLLAENESCLEYLYDTALSEDAEHVATMTGLRRIVQALVQCYDLVFIGMDGLDECEQTERSALLSMVESLVYPPDAETNVKVFLTSRAEIDVERSLGSSSRIHLKSEHLSADIQVYVNTRAIELQRFELTSESVQEITDKLVVQSAGMFLLARLMLDVFKLCVNKEDFEEELSNDMLPKGIDEAYGRILVRVTKRDTEAGRPRARQVLEILTCARRTLSIHEIQGMLSFRTDKKSIDFNNRRYLEHFKELCGPLLDVHSDETLELVHATAKKYLEDPRWGYIDQSVAKYRMAQLCTTYLTLNCFTEISCDRELILAVRRGDYAFQDYAVCNWYWHIQSLKDSANNNLVDMENLFLVVREVLNLHYGKLEVIWNLIHHQGRDEELISHGWAAINELSRACSDFESIDGSSEKGRMQFLFFNGYAFQTNSDPLAQLPEIFVQLLRIRGFIETSMDQPPEDQGQFLGKAAYGSYPYKCPVLSCQNFYQGFFSRRERDVHRKSHDRHFKCTFDECEFKTVGFPTKSALNAHVNFFHVASLTHQFSNLKARPIWQTLIDAIDNNESSLIEDLCRQGADSPDRPSGLILRAIKKSSVETINALLAHLGSIEDMDQRAVLSRAAAVRGDIEVLQLIIEFIGVDKIDGWLSMELLIKAAKKGHIEAVRVILGLRHTYRPEEKSGMSPCWSPLHSAAAAGHDEIVSLILEYPLAHYSAPHFDAAVRAAVASGAESTAKLLLERATCKDEWVKNSTMLKKASQKGPDVSVTSLSKEGFAPLVDSKGKAFRNGLQNAALASDIEKIKRYLQQGADIDQIGGENGTALQAAAVKGHVSAVRFLLDQGAKPTVEGGKYGNALAAAAANNHPELVHMLLAAGCNPSIKSYHRYWNVASFQQYLTPLHWAAHGKNREIVQILLDAKADIQAMAQSGYTPLHLAVFPSKHSKKKAIQERLPVIQLLLVHGADAKAKGENGHTPLHLVKYRSESNIEVDLEEAFGVAKILIQFGADPDEPNDKGATSRQIALDAGDDVRLRSLEVFGSYNPRAKADNGLQITTTAHAQPSDNDCGTKALEADSFAEKLLLTKSASPDARPSSPKLEPTIASSNIYLTGKISPTFTATPSAGERLGNPEIDNSLFTNPWADEDQELEATGHQPDLGWKQQNCPLCGIDEQQRYMFCSDCGDVKNLCHVCREWVAREAWKCDDCFLATS